jgi:hypothetical protein
MVFRAKANPKQSSHPNMCFANTQHGTRHYHIYVDPRFVPGIQYPYGKLKGTPWDLIALLYHATPKFNLVECILNMLGVQCLSKVSCIIARYIGQTR